MNPNTNTTHTRPAGCPSWCDRPHNPDPFNDLDAHVHAGYLVQGDGFTVDLGLSPDAGVRVWVELDARDGFTPDQALALAAAVRRVAEHGREVER